MPGDTNERVKLILAGPKDTGKTCLANYLGNLTPKLTATSRPTIGVRIVEFERTGLKLVKQKGIQKDGKVLVELWDVSGDKNFQACWPAICKDAQGLLLVFNPDSRNAEKDIEFWYKSFSPKIKDSCILVLGHHKDEEATKKPTKLPKPMVRVQVMETCTEGEDHSKIIQRFDEFLDTVVVSSREAEENIVME